MTALEISSGLTSLVIGRPIRVYSEVTSTNDIALQLASKGVQEGITIFAESQTHGRGRLGRSWNSVIGKSIMLSILLRPKWKDASRISLAAAVAVARTLESFTEESVGIKWPNDIYIAGRKVAGILCESSQGAIVVGIGINVLQETSGFPEPLATTAGSLAMVSDCVLDRAKIAASLLSEFDTLYATLPDGFESVIYECKRRSILIGRKIEATSGRTTIRGTVNGLDLDGALQIRDDYGVDRSLHAGDITLLKASS